MSSLRLQWDLIARDQASGSFNKVSASADRAAASTERASASGESFGHRIGGALGTAAKAAGLVTVAAVGAGAGLATMGIKSAAALEQTKVSFASLLGSTKAATNQIALLQKFAAKTPFEQQDVFGYAQQYYALAQSVGLSQKAVVPFLKTVGNLGAVTGATNAGIHNAVLAISQIGSAGKVTLGNLNQISNAFPGFNGAAAIAAATGQKTADVLQQISAGSLSAAKGIPELLKGMSQFNGAAGAMAKQSETLNGLFSTFTDTIKISLTNAFQGLIPTVKTSLSTLTPVISSTLNTVAPVIASFTKNLAPALAPLVHALGDGLTAVFQTLGPAVQAVVPLIPSLSRLFVNLVGAAQPLVQAIANIVTEAGGPFINTLSDVLKAITPVIDIIARTLTPILVPLAPLIASVWLAFKGYAVVKSATLALSGVGSAFSAINLAVAGVGVAVYGAVKLFDQFSARDDYVKQAAQALTDTLNSQTGAITKDTEAWVANQLEQSGVLSSAQKIGLDLNTVTRAALGHKDAIQAVNDQYKAFKRESAYALSAKGLHTGIGGQLELLRPEWDKVRNSIVDTDTALHDSQSSFGRVSAATTNQNTKQQQLVYEIEHGFVPAVKTQTTTQDAATTSTDRLKTAQDLLTGALKAAAGALSRSDALIQYQQSLNTLTSTLKGNKGLLEGHTKAALDDKSAFNQVAEQIVQTAQTMLSKGKSIPVVSAYIKKQRDNLRDAALAGDANRGAVNKLIRSLLKLPKNPRSDVTVDTSAAQNNVNTLLTSLQTLENRVAASGVLGSSVANAGPLYPPHAAGGAIRGPGGPTSDSIPARLSNGEHVLTASDVKKAGGQGAVYRMRQAIQSGGLKFAGGGAVDLLSLIRQAGFSGSAARTMYGIVMAESGGDPRAHAVDSDDNSYGLAQINMLGSLGPARRAQYGLSSNAALYNPATNLHVAYLMSGGGRNFSPWTTYTSGAYRQFLDGSLGASIAGGSSSASSAKTRLQQLHQAASSKVGNIFGRVGQSPAGPTIHLSDTGIDLVRRQLDAARAALDTNGLTDAARKKFSEQLKKLVDEARRQFKAIKLQVRTVDLSGIAKAAKGTAADVRASFKPLIDDLEAIGAKDGVIARARRQESRLLQEVNERNRAAAKLDRVLQRRKSFSQSVASGINGAFDITAAGGSAGGILANQQQTLAQIGKFEKDLNILDKRGLNRGYLMQLASQGPGALPTLDALVGMSGRQFKLFNSNASAIAREARQTGRTLGGDLYGQRVGNLRDRVHLDDKDIARLEKAIREGAREGASHASLNLDGHEINKNHHKHERRNQRHGGVG